MNNPSAHYHPLSKILHWLVAALIVLQFLLAQLAERAEHLNEPLRQLALLANHKSVGITILGFAVVRLIWRFFTPPPALPASMPRWQTLASHASHWALYALLLSLPLTGWLMSSASAYSVSWFNLFQLPDLVSADPGLKDTMAQVHEVLAKALFLLAALHIVAAIKHGVLDRDGVFQRMLSVSSLLLFVGLLVAGVLSLTSPGKSTNTRTSADSSLAPTPAQDDHSAARSDIGPVIEPEVEPEITPDPKPEIDTEIREAIDTVAEAAVETPLETPTVEAPSASFTQKESTPEPAALPTEPAAKKALVAWKIDYEQSYIRFTGDQAGARFTGEWTSWEADIFFSQADLASSSFDVTVDTRKVDTGDEDRDTTIGDPDWFDSENHPFAHYRANRFERRPNIGFVASGQLFVKGQPAPVDLNFTVTGDNQRRVVEGSSVTRVLLGNALLDRLALGLGLGDWEDTTWVGQEVTVEVHVEATVSDSVNE